jgi:hypothetical protein
VEIKARREGRVRGWGEVNEWRKNNGRWTEETSVLGVSVGLVSWILTFEGMRAFAQLGLALELGDSEVDSVELSGWTCQWGHAVNVKLMAITFS